MINLAFADTITKITFTRRLVVRMVVTYTQTDIHNAQDKPNLAN